MSTKNFVPRANNEGGIGTETKQWGSVWSKNMYVDGTNVKNKLTILEQDLGSLNTSMTSANTALAAKATTFNNVDAMKAGNLAIGATALTLGYYSINDGGNALYNIRAAISGESYDNGSLILLNNGNVAELITDGTVSYKQFGAKADGVENDYGAIKACHVYANTTKKTVVNHGGSYYATGETILVATDVYNYDGVTFIVGNDNLKTNELFLMQHDADGVVADIDNVAIKTFMSNEFTIDNDYSQLFDKFFIIRTAVSLGLASNGINQDYITEPMVSDSNRTVLTMDSYATVKEWIVDITDISYTGEQGYTWSGGTVRSYDDTTYGICFLRINRNNCIVERLNLKVEDTLGEHYVIRGWKCCNLTIRDITLNTKSTPTWGYNIGYSYVSNVLLQNIKTAHGSSGNTFGSGNIKNITLENSRVWAFGGHANAFGDIIAFNCDIDNVIIGYGNGTIHYIDCRFTVATQTRNDYLPMFMGNIVFDNCTFPVFGFILRMGNENGTTPETKRDLTYFATITPPTFKFLNCKFNAYIGDIYVEASQKAYLASKVQMIYLSCSNMGVFRIEPAVDATYNGNPVDLLDMKVFECNPNSTAITSYQHLGELTINNKKLKYSITAETDVTINDLRFSEFYRFGYETHLQLCADITIDLAAYKPVISFPSKYAPSETTYIIGMLNGTATVFYLKNDGKLYTTAVTHVSSVRLYIDTSWC